MSSQSDPVYGKCPNCGGIITAQTIICGRCGVTVPPMTVQWTPPQPGARHGRKGAGKIWLGIAVANVGAILTLLLNQWLLGLGGSSNGIFIASDFTVVPLAMGMVTAYFWRDLDLTGIQYLGYACLNSLFTMACAAVVLREGSICLLMASPLLISVIWVGSLIGRALFPRSNNRLNAALVPLMLTLVVGDSLMPHQFQNSEADTIVIHAPAQHVWRSIVDYPKITEKPDYWLFRIGLPYPVQATSSGHFVGADRKCIFSKNAIFDERIVEMEPNKKLTFDIVTQPADPEIVGHLCINRGQFLLHDNGDGTTTVTGTSWYHLNVYPTWYYDWWTQDIIRHVHLRAMRHIKMLAEARQ